MPKRMYDFQCVSDDAHVFEKFCDVELRTAVCPECGELANRIVSPVRCELEPFSGAYPGAYYAWNQKRAQKMAQERKKNS